MARAARAYNINDQAVCKISAGIVSDAKKLDGLFDAIARLGDEPRDEEYEQAFWRHDRAEQEQERAVQALTYFRAVSPEARAAKAVALGVVIPRRADGAPAGDAWVHLADSLSRDFA